MPRPTRSRRFSRLAAGVRAIGAASGAALLSSTAIGQELPAGGHTGCATLTYDGGRLTVTQQIPNCVIEWDSFRIGAGGIVDFLQADTWRVLNRVTGEEFTRIAGMLRSDGTVYIVNPAGFVFTGGAVIDVGGFYAAAASMTDDDFLAGRDRFTDPSGEVVNDGAIRAGVVHLLGERVLNRGTIDAPGGIVTLLAAEDEILIGESDGRILVRLDGVDLTRDLAVSRGGVTPTLSGPAGVENTGTINAAGGQVVLGVGDMYSLAVESAGTIDARGGSAQIAALGGTVQHGGADAALAAGDLSMTGDVLYLDGDLNVDTARFNDAVVLGADVLIEGEDDGERATTVHFVSTVDSADGEHHDLTIDARDTFLDGHVGQSNRLGAIDLSGRAQIARNLRATDGITLGDDTTFTAGGSQTVDAGDGALTARGDLTKSVGSSLTLLAGTAMDLDGHVTVDTPTGSLTLTAPSIDADGNLVASGGDVRITGVSTIAGSVTAGLDVTFGDDTVIGGNVVSGEDALFFGDAVVGGSVTALEDIEFRAGAEVGGNVTAGKDAEFSEDAIVGGDVTAFEDVQFAGEATVGGDIWAGDDADFAGAADIGGSVTAGDDAVFLADAKIGGSVTAGDDAIFLADANVGGSVTAVEDAEFFGDARVGGDVRAGDDALFMGELVAGGGVSAGDDAEFHARAKIGGDVFGGDDVQFFDKTTVGGDVAAGDDAEFHARGEVGGRITAGDDVEFFDRAIVGGSIAAVGDVVFTRRADVRGDITAEDDVDVNGKGFFGGDITAGDNVTMDKAVALDGSGDQRIEATGGVLRTKKTLTKETRGALTLTGGERIVFNGSSVEARDDVRLNPGGRPTPPEVATITALEDLEIVSRRGEVVMGPNQVFTALHDLRIEAARSATLGDITTRDDLVVDAPRILARTRAGQLRLYSDGQLRMDEGLDFMAGGRLFFSVTPEPFGDGAAPLFGSAQAPGDGVGTLAPFRVRLQVPFARSQLRFEDSLLDIVVDGAVGSPLATAFTPAPKTVEPGVASRLVVTPGARGALARLGLEPRARTAEELRAAQIGSVVYDDLPDDPAIAPTVARITTDRLDATSTRLVLDRSETLALGARADGPAGDGTRARTILAVAWQSYETTTPDPTGRRFRVHLAATIANAEALALLDDLRDLFGEMRLMGATPAEVRLLRQHILGELTPEAMSVDQLEAAVGG